MGISFGKRTATDGPGATLRGRPEGPGIDRRAQPARSPDAHRHGHRTRGRHGPGGPIPGPALRLAFLLANSGHPAGATSRRMMHRNLPRLATRVKPAPSNIEMDP